MAVHLGMNRGHLSDIETGKREAGIITLQVIARGLDTTMATLLKGLNQHPACRRLSKAVSDAGTAAMKGVG